MKKETKIFTIDQIADFLGVQTCSIHRWVDSGKLKCLVTSDGNKQFTLDHLMEFANTYNISMKFLMEAVKREQLSNEKILHRISAAQ